MERPALSNPPPESFRRGVEAQFAGRLAEAEAAYRETILSFPDAVPPRLNLATVLETQRRWSGAEDQYSAVLAQSPEHPRARLNLGLSRLAAGDYPQGWPLYEARREVEEGRVLAPRLATPEWDGRPIGSVLIMPEQGLGDQIQFARYAPVLQGLGIAPTLVCHPSLRRLFSPLGVEIIAAEGQAILPPHDAWTLAGSLPLRLGTTLASIPPPPKLAPDHAGGRGIGIAWRGNPIHHNDANRSLPPDVAAALMRLPGAISLHPEDTGARDFQDTAEIASALSLVISVDTSIAHLAASLGVETWVLLPGRRTDWRWLRDRPDSPWYPTARLFRQSIPGDWSSVVAQVLTEAGSRGAA